MSLDRVPAGNDVPNDCNVIIEIPMHADPIKYEVDKETGAVFVDRFMSTAMHYPCNYGYIPQTLSDDGDPCDVLVLSPVPLITGVVVRCRPIGMLQDGRRGGRRRQDPRGADRQAVVDCTATIQSPRDLPEITTRRSRISSSTTRTSSRASGCGSPAGSGPRKRGRRSSHSVERYRGREPARSRVAGCAPALDAGTALDLGARAQPAFPALFVVLWSTGFIAAKYGLPYAPPLTFLLVRFALVAR